LHVRRYAFDVEVLTALRNLNAKILEVPSLKEIRLRGVHGPKIILDMFRELLAILYRHKLFREY